MTTVEEDVEDAQVDLPWPPAHHTPANAATTCSSQWRRDAKVLGSPPLRTLGSLGPLPSVHVQYPRWFESTSGSRAAVRTQSLRDASPGSESSPSSPGRFWGRRPFVRSAIVRWQEATDPQSPKGGSQRACHTEGAHLGVSKEWRCFSSRPCLGSLEAVSLCCQPGSSESAPFPN